MEIKTFERNLNSPMVSEVWNKKHVRVFTPDAFCQTACALSGCVSLSHGELNCYQRNLESAFVLCFTFSRFHGVLQAKGRTYEGYRKGWQERPRDRWSDIWTHSKSKWWKSSRTVDSKVNSVSGKAWHLGWRSGKSTMISTNGRWKKAHKSR